MQAGLNFLQAAATGNFAAAEALLAPEVVCLTTLTVIHPDDVPFLTLSRGQNFATYTNNYDQRIFAYADFTGLFDNWERYTINGWRPSANSFLFMGNQLRPNGRDVFADQALVFIIEEINGRMLIRAFP